MGATEIEWATDSWNPVTGCTPVSAGCDRLDQPRHWRKPRRVFVCSMGDLFHPDVPFEFIEKVFAVIAMCQQHTFMVLTKRPENMHRFLTNRSISTLWLRICFAASQLREGGIGSDRLWPLLNLWLGVTCEDQAAARERLKWLLKCPAAVRYVR